VSINLAPVPNSQLTDANGNGTPPLIRWMNAVRAAFAAVPSTVKALVPLFSHYTTAGTASVAETDLYSDTLAAGQFAADGDMVYVDFTAQYAAGGATRRVRLYVAGTVVYDTGAIVAAGSTFGNGWAWIVREDSSTLRVTTSGLGNNSTSATVVSTTYTRITGLTLANTQIIKLTGQSSLVAANDVAAVSMATQYLPAP